MFLRQGDRLRDAYRITQGTRTRLTVPLLFFSEDGYGLKLDLSLGPAKTKQPLQSPLAPLSETALLEAGLPGTITLRDFESYRDLSLDERDALMQREKDIGERLAHARYDAALTALASSDPSEVEKGVTVATSYMRRGAAASDVPLLVALLDAPGGADRLFSYVLNESPSRGRRRRGRCRT